MKQINWCAFFTSMAASTGIGALSSLFTSQTIQQYSTMYKPPLSPPGWLFPIVWTILYTLMGIAAYLVYTTEADKEAKTTALLTYAIQLIVNFIWPIIFFNLNAYWLAFAWILLLWYMIYLTIKRFYDINKTAGIIMIPYLLWVTFAAYLTLAIALNPAI